MIKTLFQPSRIEHQKNLFFQNLIYEWQRYAVRKHINYHKIAHIKEKDSYNQIFYL